MRTKNTVAAHSSDTGRARAYFKSLRSQLHITKLPMDTLIHILSFLTPRDILSIRRSCRALSAATMLKTVWIGALRTSCRETQIFKGTYPIEDMSRPELEYATTRHYRFLDSLWKGLSDNLEPLRPVSIRILNLHPRMPSIADHPFGYFKQSALIPGGRFLITTTTSDIVQMWDLGFTPSGLIKTCPLTSVHIPGLDDEYIMLMQPSSDGNAVRVLLVVRVEGELNFKIYEIIPTSPASSFNLLGELIYHQVDVDAYTMAGNRFAFHYENNVVVWDFVLDSSVAWIYTPNLTDLIFSGENELICTGQVEFAIFKIPPLDHGLPSIINATPHNPILRLSCSLEDNFVSAQAGWRPGASGVEYFDSIGEDEDNMLAVYRYVLKSIANDPMDGLPSTIPIVVDWFRDQMLEHGWNKSTAWKMSENERLIGWSNEDGLFLHLSTTGSIDNRVTTGFLWHWPIRQDEHVDRHHAFCPISGRLCVSSWDHEIRVLDYIAPPNE